MVAALLIVALVHGLDWRPVPGYLANIDWRWAALGGVALTSHFFVSPWKWRWALRIHRLEYDLLYLVRANGIGFFFNNFLPSAIGGDAYRIMSTWPRDGFRSRAVSAVVIERVIGLIVLIAIGNFGALWLASESELARVFLGVSLVAACVGLALLAAVAAGGLSRLSSRALESGKLQALAHNLELLRNAGGRWIPLLSISLLFQAIAVLYIYALFQSLGSPVSVASCALIAAVAGLASILPLSINGIGIIEGSFAAAAVALGVGYEVALIVAVLIRLFVLPLSLIFGVIYAVGHERVVPATMLSAE